MFISVKYLLRSVSALALIGGVLTSMSAHAEMVSVSRAEANFRAGPGTRYQANWRLDKGYPLVVISRKGNWIQARDFENDRGWIYRSLTNRVPHHVVRVATANLRQQPTTRSRILSRLDYGEVLRTLGKKGGWVKVRAEKGGPAGWIAKNLVWGW